MPIPPPLIYAHSHHMAARFMAGALAWQAGAIVIFGITFLSAQILNFQFFIFNLFATAVMLKPLKNKIKEQRCLSN